MSHVIDLRLRRKALKLWVKQVPLAMIVELTGVNKWTIKDWRFRYQWPPRKSYASRPQRKDWRLGDRQPVISRDCTFACPACGTRASDPKGHPICVEVA